MFRFFFQISGQWQCPCYLFHEVSKFYTHIIKEYVTAVRASTPYVIVWLCSVWCLRKYFTLYLDSELQTVKRDLLHLLIYRDSGQTWRKSNCSLTPIINFTIFRNRTLDLWERKCKSCNSFGLSVYIFVLGNFDALAQTGDFQIERRQVAMNPDQHCQW